MARTPTSAANTARIEAAFNKMTPVLENLAFRWADEKEYEDIKDYERAFKVKLAEYAPGFTFIGITKRPFGFKFDIGTDAEYAMFATMRNVGWKRTK